MVTRSKIYTQDPQLLLTTAKNLLARLTWQLGFVHPCTRKLRKVDVGALPYLYSLTNITRITTSENVRCLRYVEVKDVIKIWVQSLNQW